MSEATPEGRIVELEIERDIWKEEVRARQLEIVHLRSEIARLHRALADKMQDPIGEL
jgi:predicted  nucleic acid-binding Zn-ribbon protein